MLVLLRKVGESIVIGKDIIVRVVRVSRTRAFLAIEHQERVRRPQGNPLGEGSRMLCRGALCGRKDAGGAESDEAKQI